ncbi:MAG: hypothetical protein EA380_06030, partial [Phycisphaeraceae bacterium]
MAASVRAYRAWSHPRCSIRRRFLRLRCRHPSSRLHPRRRCRSRHHPWRLPAGVGGVSPSASLRAAPAVRATCR